MLTRLRSSGLSLLSPQQERSAGIHHSHLLDRICRMLGHYEPNPEGISDCKAILSQAFEGLVARDAMERFPGELLHNPELEVDGIYLTPDLPWIKERVDWEIKVTWMKPCNTPADLKMWKYLEQLKGYLYAWRRFYSGTATMRVFDRERNPSPWIRNLKPEDPGGSWLTGLLTVCFVNDYRPQAEQIPTWEITFTKEELALHWAAIRSECEVVKREQEEQEQREGEQGEGIE